jgi:protein required for attachment to host cells
MMNGSVLALVADGRDARFFSRAALGAVLVELGDKHMCADPGEPARDHVPRVFDRIGGGRHGVEDHLTPHEAAEAAFLHKVAERVNQIVARGAFENLVLCAPPRALGVLRSSLSESSRDRIRLTIDKDLCRETSAEIDTRLAELRI